jgi:tetratricopeptide (TPR) repeat protein
MAGIGGSALQVTSHSTQAAEFVRQGIVLLHCFWDFEALRAFREAERLDPSCAMAQWGIAFIARKRESMREELKTGLDKAKELIGNASEHEQYYLRALIEENEAGNEKGAAAYTRAMEALADRYPEDVDARLFLALAVMAGYEPDGKPRSGQLYAQSLLAELIRSHPTSAGAHHYWIHSMESSRRPEAALESARQLAKLAPRSGHMTHMPGHIFYRMGDYASARKAFLASMEVDEDYLKTQHLSARENWNYTHNLSYLVASCAEDGHYAEGIRYAQKLKGLPASPDMVKMYATAPGSTLPRFRIRYGRYEDVTSADFEMGAQESNVSPQAIAYRDGFLLFASGMAALEKGDLPTAHRLNDELDALLWRTEKAAQAEMKSQKENGSQYRGVGVAGALELASWELRGVIASKEGRHEEALRILEQAISKQGDLGYMEPPLYSRPLHETLGYALIAAGHFEEARHAFEKGLIQRPNSGHGLLGIARAYAAEGNRSAAGKAYAAFLKAWSDADRDLPEIVEARSHLSGGIAAR